MRITTTLAGLATVLLLAGCLGNDVNRAAVGAAGGAVLADITDNDVLAGAAIGGVAGALCDDAGVCN